ncbi:MAG TPA: GIY-YIG nuclease family protein [Accumulibacter sp.]|nr:GIY-YIG nuclease family protein [Anaerolineae bacterium]MCP5333504.1 GIY-YIG nuclease family protein [Pseudomonadales bacterium]HNF92546.1 GIY-YIG nuclease family protein [Accumulibacter sp.]HNO73713.1 GIY-YIG nuclease family protein [Accumulibacter sp.]
MSAYIYCLYSTGNGVPRYVGLTDEKVSYRFKQHITAALEKEPGAVYDWIRDAWRQGCDVAVFILQEGIMPNDYAMFEQYWIDQFADLLNVLDNRDGKSNSTIAKQVINAIQAQLKLGRRAVPRDTT